MVDGIPPLDSNAPKASEELAGDVGRLMDEIADEVKALMMDSVQKAASYCASLCAERVVAARREVQQRWVEERRELKRLNSPLVPPGPSTPRGLSPSPSLPSILNMGVALQTSPVAQKLPSRPTSDHGGTPDSSKASIPSMSATKDSTPRAKESPKTPISWASPGSGTFVPPPLAPPPLPPRSPRAKPSSRPGGAQEEEAALEFIDTYDAVQTLEESTIMAARAMDLLDQALKTPPANAPAVARGQGAVTQPQPPGVTGKPREPARPLAIQRSSSPATGTRSPRRQFPKEAVAVGVSSSGRAAAGWAEAKVGGQAG